jgi:hypothetical protein
LRHAAAHYSDAVIVINGILHFCPDISVDSGKKKLNSILLINPKKNLLLKKKKNLRQILSSNFKQVKVQVIMI